MEENGKLLNPGARAARTVLVGSPVKFTDGYDWIVPALPVGPIGDPIIAAQSTLARLQTELEIIEARQQNEFSRDLAAVIDDESETEARERYAKHQERIDALATEISAIHIDFVHLTLSLHYHLTAEEVASITGLKQVRKVTGILAGAPQLEELAEAMETLKGGPGN